MLKNKTKIDIPIHDSKSVLHLSKILVYSLIIIN